MTEYAKKLLDINTKIYKDWIYRTDYGFGEIDPITMNPLYQLEREVNGLLYFKSFRQATLILRPGETAKALGMSRPTYYFMMENLQKAGALTYESVGKTHRIFLLPDSSYFGGRLRHSDDCFYSCPWIYTKEVMILGKSTPIRECLNSTKKFMFFVLINVALSNTAEGEKLWRYAEVPEFNLIWGYAKLESAMEALQTGNYLEIKNHKDVPAGVKCYKIKLPDFWLSRAVEAKSQEHQAEMYYEKLLNSLSEAPAVLTHTIRSRRAAVIEELDTKKTFSDHRLYHGWPVQFKIDCLREFIKRKMTQGMNVRLIIAEWREREKYAKANPGYKIFDMNFIERLEEMFEDIMQPIDPANEIEMDRDELEGTILAEMKYNKTMTMWEKIKYLEDVIAGKIPAINYDVEKSTAPTSFYKKARKIERGPKPVKPSSPSAKAPDSLFKEVMDSNIPLKEPKNEKK